MAFIICIKYYKLVTTHRGFATYLLFLCMQKALQMQPWVLTEVMHTMWALFQEAGSSSDILSHLVYIANVTVKLCLKLQWQMFKHRLGLGSSFICAVWQCTFQQFHTGFLHLCASFKSQGTLWRWNKFIWSDPKYLNIQTYLTSPLKKPLSCDKETKISNFLLV